MKVQPYLHFEGNCEEALSAYARIFGGETSGITRYGEAPVPQTDGWADKIMNATFSAPGLEMMAADSPHKGFAAVGASRATLAIALEDVAEGKRIFEALAEGGAVTMPYEKQFWGATFGMLTDRFGIDWMVNAG